MGDYGWVKRRRAIQGFRLAGARSVFAYAGLTVYGADAKRSAHAMALMFANYGLCYARRYLVFARLPTAGVTIAGL